MLLFRTPVSERVVWCELGLDRGHRVRGFGLCTCVCAPGNEVWSSGVIHHPGVKNGFSSVPSAGVRSSSGHVSQTCCLQQERWLLFSFIHSFSSHFVLFNFSFVQTSVLVFCHFSVLWLVPTLYLYLYLKTCRNTLRSLQFLQKRF